MSHLLQQLDQITYHGHYSDCFIDLLQLQDIQGCETPESSAIINVSHQRHGHATSPPQTRRQFSRSIYGNSFDLFGVQFPQKHAFTI